MIKANSSYIILLIHIFLWIVVIQLVFDISGLYYSFRDLFFEDDNKRFDEAFLFIPFFIGLFYWNSQYLIPKFFKKSTWWKYLALLIISSFFVFFTLNQLYSFIENQGYFFELTSYHFSDMALFLSLLTIGISTSLGIAKIALEQTDKKKAAEQKQKKAELKYLQAQVNPHFLFNTLNSLYTLAIEEDAPNTTEAILKLSEIMRYPLKKGTEETVLLSDEIKFLEGYIDLQKLRLGYNYPINFEVNGDITGIKVAPLLFISFIENAFKYGISQQTKSPISIKINYEVNQLTFQCINHIAKTQNVESYKLGIQNTSQRLNLLYENNHTLHIKEQNNQYSIDLIIQIL